MVACDDEPPDSAETYDGVFVCEISAGFFIVLQKPAGKLLTSEGVSCGGPARVQLSLI
jgi:hypothetical protein